MCEIIPGLSDVGYGSTSGLPTTELIIIKDHQKHIHKELETFAIQYIEWAVGRVSQILTDGDTNTLNGMLLGFLTAREYITISGFLKCFTELPRIFQMLVIKTLHTISSLAEAQKLIDWVYVVTELEALEKKFPGQLSWQDYHDAHNPELGSQFHQSVDYIKARLSGDVIF